MVPHQEDLQLSTVLQLQLHPLTTVLQAKATLKTEDNKDTLDSKEDMLDNKEDKEDTAMEVDTQMMPTTTYYKSFYLVLQIYYPVISSTLTRKYL